ncbi:heme biosynthesis protein HemY [Brucellaceae bacterium C25G]
MIRIIIYVLIIVALGLGFGWLADRPGELVMMFGGQRYRISLMVASASIVALVAAFMLCWWFIKNIYQSPVILTRHFRARKRDRGYQSLSTGLIAAGAGDAETARRMTAQASKLINSDQEPLIKLLEAQTAMLEGRAEDARLGFEAMVEDPETRLLGLRGLYIEALRMGAYDAARNYAAEAARHAPQLEWASSAVLGQLCAEGHWDAALNLVDARKQSLRQTKDVAKKERAALLTAKAMAKLDTEPLEARSIALEAHKLNPDLVPASIVAARSLFAQGEVRKASKILEAAWKKQPHPDIADIYVHGRSGDTAQDRLKRARHLVSLNSQDVESHLALARAAYDANEFKLARAQIDQVLKTAPRKSAYLLLADIEEADSGDQGLVRQWLGKALKAPRDPVWTADGYVSQQWAPVSPVTGRLNSFEWKVPVEELAPMIEAEQQDVFGQDDDIIEEKPLAPLMVIEPEKLPETKKKTNQASSKPIADEAKPAEADPVHDKKKITDTRVHKTPLTVVDDPGVHPDDTGAIKTNNMRLF